MLALVSSVLSSSCFAGPAHTDAIDRPAVKTFCADSLPGESSTTLFEAYSVLDNNKQHDSTSVLGEFRKLMSVQHSPINQILLDLRCRAGKSGLDSCYGFRKIAASQ